MGVIWRFRTDSVQCLHTLLATMAWGVWQDGASSSGRLIAAAGAAVAAAIVAERFYYRWRYRRFYALPTPAGEQLVLGHMNLFLGR